MNYMALILLASGKKHWHMVSPMRGLRRFNVKGKLARWCIDPFKIIYQRGEVAYQLELPTQLSDVHNVFHVSELKKCIRVHEEHLPMKEIDIGGDLSYDERLIKILETTERVTWSNVIKMFKVQWTHHMETNVRGTMKKISE
jgi:hypothetical protein